VGSIVRAGLRGRRFVERVGDGLLRGHRPARGPGDRECEGDVTRAAQASVQREALLAEGRSGPISPHGWACNLRCASTAAATPIAIGTTIRQRASTTGVVAGRRPTPRPQVHLCPGGRRRRLALGRSTSQLRRSVAEPVPDGRLRLLGRLTKGAATRSPREPQRAVRQPAERRVAQVPTAETSRPRPVLIGKDGNPAPGRGRFGARP
jgi:hypothetical protein